MWFSISRNPAVRSPPWPKHPRGSGQAELCLSSVKMEIMIFYFNVLNCSDGKRHSELNIFNISDPLDCYTLFQVV